MERFRIASWLARRVRHPWLSAHSAVHGAKKRGVVHIMLYRQPLKWAMTGSNCRHPACKAGALPAELIALTKTTLPYYFFDVNINIYFFSTWTLNPRATKTAASLPQARGQHSYAWNI